MLAPRATRVVYRSSPAERAGGLLLSFSGSGWERKVGPVPARLGGSGRAQLSWVGLSGVTGHGHRGSGAVGNLGAGA